MCSSLFWNEHLFYASPVVSRHKFSSLGHKNPLNVQRVYGMSANILRQSGRQRGLFDQSSFSSDGEKVRQTTNVWLTGRRGPSRALSLYAESRAEFGLRA